MMSSSSKAFRRTRLGNPKFPSPRKLLDSETVGKKGEESQRAKGRVHNIIRRDVSKCVEDNHMFDGNGKVALRSVGPVIQLPTNSQQQRPLLHPNPLSMVPVPIPFPITVNKTVCAGNTGIVNKGCSCSSF